MLAHGREHVPGQIDDVPLIEAGKAALGAQIIGVLHDAAAEAGSVVNRLGESVIGSEGQAFLEAPLKLQIHRVIDGIAHRRIVGEAGGVADQAALLRGERRAGRGAVGHELQIQASALVADVATLQINAVLKAVLQAEIPVLHIRHAIIFVDRVRICDVLIRRGGEAIGEREDAVGTGGD